MNEFSLIDTYFKSISLNHEDIIFGIGDDAACLQIPPNMHLLVSCDTLVADVHFLSSWDAYDIAYKAVMVNVSDIAAMGGQPSWLVLSLTLPTYDEKWLQRFSQGLSDALNQYHIALIGGDTTHGPLSMSLTIHGFIPKNKAVRRSGAHPGDKIYVSGHLGAAAYALVSGNRQDINKIDKNLLTEKLQHPFPRVDLNSILQSFATAAIDISDGLSADLNHICEESHVGACLMLDNIPIHPLVKKYDEKNALDFALSGGDDYELCFTINPKNEAQFLSCLAEKKLQCYCIGVIEEQTGLRGIKPNEGSVPLKPKGYSHF